MSSGVAIGLEWGEEGAQSAARRDDIIVVVDALRATSTIATALAHGVRSVRPVALMSQCHGELTAGEVGGARSESCDLDNSPLAFVDGTHRGKELVLKTSNGTPCVVASSHSSGDVIAGSLLNATGCGKFVANRSRQSKRNVSFVLAGRRGKPTSEDGIAAAAIAQAIGPCESLLEFARTPEELEEAFLESPTGQHLVELGKTDDVRFCARLDAFDVVPVFKDGLFTAEWGGGA